MTDRGRPERQSENMQQPEWVPSADCLALLQSVPYAMGITDSDLTLQCANSSMKSLLSKNNEANYSLLQLLDKTVVADFKASLARLHTNPSSAFSRTIEFVSASGDFYHADCIIFPVRFFCEKQYYGCLFKDRSVDKKLTDAIQRAFNRLQVLTEGITDLVLEINQSSNILFANHGILGKTKQELQGMSVFELLPKSLHQKLEKSFAQKEDQVLEFIHEQNNQLSYYKGRLRVVDQAPDEVFAVLLISDVTNAFVKTQELLKNRQELQQSITARDKFMSIIAHDLKAPFNALISFGQLLTETMLEKRYDKANRLINLINESALHSYNLIENLLTWSRAKQGHLTCSPTKFSIHEAITDTFELLQSVAYSKNIVLLCHAKDHIHAHADYNMIKTVLRNLVSNSIKFTHTNGTIAADYRVKDSHIIVSIEDNGTGMTPETLNSLFKEQKPVSSIGTNKEKGTGLGLLVCKEFIIENGGEISVASTYGKGTKTIFSLPLHQPELDVQED